MEFQSLTIPKFSPQASHFESQAVEAMDLKSPPRDIASPVFCQD